MCPIPGTRQWSAHVTPDRSAIELTDHTTARPLHPLDLQLGQCECWIALLSGRDDQISEVFWISRRIQRTFVDGDLAVDTRGRKLAPSSCSEFWVGFYGINPQLAKSSKMVG